MPWTVRIVNDQGKPVSGQDLLLHWDVLDNLPLEAVMLRGIDEYDDTLFTACQTRRFIEEWDTLLPSLTSETQNAQWRDVRSYAERLINEFGNGFYLKFIGD
jgi:hypothetical protein